MVVAPGGGSVAWGWGGRRVVLGERCRSGRAARCGPRGTGGRQVGGPAGGRGASRPRDPVLALAPAGLACGVGAVSLQRRHCKI